MKIQVMTAVRAGRFGLAALALATLLTTSASAAIVTWGAATTIIGDTDVDTVGTLDRAYNFHRTDIGTSTPLISPTVNGVTFTGFAIQANAPFIFNYGTGGPDTTLTYGGNTTLASSADELGALNLADGDNFGAGSGTFAGLSAPYKNLLGSAAIEDYSTAAVAEFTLTLTGLSINTPYRVQFWTNDSRIGDNGNTTVTSGNVVVLNRDIGAAVGDVGQWAIGTFTANATSQAFTIGIAGIEAAQISAFQLRIVPEPSSFALLMFGSVGLWLMKRKRGG